MSAPLHSLPLNARQVADEFFIENRTRILDIAAFLDRLDRADVAVSEGSTASSGADFRVIAFREALQALAGAEGNRIQAVQMIFSDPTTEPLDELDQKSARGSVFAREWAQIAVGGVRRKQWTISISTLTW